jgi:Na+/alanine symporter
VVTAALVLVPQNLRLLGLEIVVLAVPMLVITVRNQLADRRRNPNDPRLWFLSRMTCTAAATVPASLAGLSLAVHWGGGLYWLAVTALLGIIGAVYAAWVLLIEIVR